MDSAGRLVESIESGRMKRSRDPIAAAVACAEAGASELMIEGRAAPYGVVVSLTRTLRASLAVPFTIGAEPTNIAQVEELLSNGATRVAIQRAALADPDFMAEVSRRFGPESLAVAVTVRREGRIWRVYEGPRGLASEWDAVTWARVVEAQGAGELVVEAVGGDASGGPFDLELLSEVSRSVARTLVAAGDAGSVEDLFDALMLGNADAVLVGSLLHSGVQTLDAIKDYLAEHGIACDPSAAADDSSALR